MATTNGEPAADRHVQVGGNVVGAVVTGNDNKVDVHATTVSRRQRHAIWAAVTAGLLASVAVVAVVISANRAPDRPAVQFGAYTVTVRGSAIGGAAFDLQGELRIRKGAAKLPYKWCLKVGNPWGAPAPGMIWFGSHGTCFGAGTSDPLVEIRTSGTETSLVPLEPARPAGENANAFTATTGLLATAYVPDRGELRFRVQESTLTGTIGLLGLSAFGDSGRGTMTATFAAARVSEDPDALISSPIQPVPWVSDDSTPQRHFPGTRYTVKTVIDFTRLSGSAAWTDRARARFAGAVLIVDTSGGKFMYDPPDARSDLFPVTGGVTGAGPVYVLAGQRRSGDLTTTVGGTLDTSGAEPTATLTFTSGEESHRATAVLQRA
ncbi:hypothetical protein [Actinoplanes sp. NPDC026619]|uniref:hypothetical protein n=1 Tax=Actinoplanes sp. NPDC026619 TaxID=3155798 RepID=UPI0033EEACCF